MGGRNLHLAKEGLILADTPAAKGATPKDLDSYLTVPQGARPDCVINYKNKVRVVACALALVRQWPLASMPLCVARLPRRV